MKKRSFICVTTQGAGNGRPSLPAFAHARIFRNVMERKNALQRRVKFLAKPGTAMKSAHFSERPLPAQGSADMPRAAWQERRGCLPMGRIHKGQQISGESAGSTYPPGLWTTLWISTLVHAWMGTGARMGRNAFVGCPRMSRNGFTHKQERFTHIWERLERPNQAPARLCDRFGPPCIGSLGIASMYRRHVVGSPVPWTAALPTVRASHPNDF